jgi:hypothetical protein
LATFLAKSITCSNALDFPIILSKEYLSEIAFLIVGLSKLNFFQSFVNHGIILSLSSPSQYNQKLRFHGLNTIGNFAISS